MLGAHVLAWPASGAPGTSGQWRGTRLGGRKAESEFAFPPTTPYSDSEEKGGRHNLRAEFRCNRSVDRLRLAATSTNVQAEDAYKSRTTFVDMRSAEAALLNTRQSTSAA